MKKDWFIMNYTPRNPDTVRKQIEDTKQLIKLHLNLLKKFPEDRALKLSLEQYLHLLRGLAREWKLARAFQEAVEKSKPVYLVLKSSGAGITSFFFADIERGSDD